MTKLWMTFALLLGTAGVIYLSCEYFVNGVEWLGHRMAIGQKATGTILAAFGTALPESVVTFVAVAFGGTVAARDIGVGAALGGPLALSTIAYATVGIMLLTTGQRLPATAEIRGQFARLSRDQGWFLMIFFAKIALGLVLFVGKSWFGVLFFAAYALYVRQEMVGGVSDDEGELEPLKLQPRSAMPSTARAAVQTGFSLIVIFVASRIFVE